MLFLPPTAGTLACFCGPTCQCVGCATHDPHSRKRPAPGACSGGGCHCGTEKGCEDGTIGATRAKGPGTGSKKSRNDAGPNGCCGQEAQDEGEALGRQQTNPNGTVEARRSCCGSKPALGASSAMSRNEGLPLGLLAGPLPGSADLALPSLWSSSSSSSSPAEAGLVRGSDAEAPAVPSRSGEPSRSGTVTPATTTPLPSLRTLWPALLDLDETAAGPGGSVEKRHHLGHGQGQGDGAGDSADPSEGRYGDRPAYDAYLELPAGLLDPALEPAILRSSSAASATSTSTLPARAAGDGAKLVLTACSACFLEEPLDDACGSGDGEEDEGAGGGCQCTSRCGCRGGHGEGGGGVGGGEGGETLRQEGEVQEKELKSR